MDRSLAVIAIVAALVAVPAAARAETAAVLPVAAATEILSASRDGAAAAALACLQHEGVRATGPSDVEHLLLAGDPLAACRTADCAPQVAQRLGVDFVVVLTLWARPHASTIQRVSIILATQDGRTFGGESDVTDAKPLGTAVTAALDEARQRHTAGNRGALRITTTPPGATVRIDGEYSGETPYFHMVDPGRHQLQIDATGYATERRSIVVELHRDTEITSTLVVSHDTATRTTTRDEHPVVGPLLLGLVGLALLTPDVGALTQVGCNGATCNELDGVPFAFWAIAGGAAMISAIIWALTTTRVVANEPVRVAVGPLSIAVLGQL